MEGGAQARNIVFMVRRRLPNGCICSRALTWLETGTIFHGAAILTYFTWLLSFPSWVVMWRGYAATYTDL
jgi:hypothetical protein